MQIVLPRFCYVSKFEALHCLHHNATRGHDKNTAQNSLKRHFKQTAHFFWGLDIDGG